MRVASFAPRSVKSARSFFPVRRFSSLPIWRLVSVISASVLRRRCFRVSTSARSGFRLASAAWSSSSRCCAARFSASRVSRRDDTSRSRASTSVGSSTPASTSSFRLLAWPSRPSVVLATSSPMSLASAAISLSRSSPSSSRMNSSFRSLLSSERKFPVRAWQEKMLERKKSGVPAHLRTSSSYGSFLPLVSGLPSPLKR